MKYVLSVLVSFALVLTFAPQVEAQTKILEFTPRDFGAGVGAFFAEEGETFNQDSLFGALDAYMVKVPVADGSLGVSVELSFPTNENGTFLKYQLWSLNRAAVPGTKGKMYGGADLKFMEGGGGGEDDGANFDARLVVGARLGDVGSGVLFLEFYSLEEDSPLSFAVKYQF